MTGLESVALLHKNNNIFSCSIESNPVKLEASLVILLPLLTTCTCSLVSVKQE